MDTRIVQVCCVWVINSPLGHVHYPYVAGWPRRPAGPAALMDSVLPVWRKYRLVRTDWSLEAQVYALQALMTGFLGTATRTQALRGVTVDASENVMAAAVTAVLGPEEAGPAELRATVEEGLRLLRERRNTLLALITTKQENRAR